MRTAIRWIALICFGLCGVFCFIEWLRADQTQSFLWLAAELVFMRRAKEAVDELTEEVA